ncbi:MAG: cobalamin-dependent protein [Pseudomonadota bacterium]
MAISANPFAGELLEVGAQGYAAQAAEELLEAHPDVKATFAPRAELRWRDNLQLRVRELAAAVATGQADLFLSRVVWSWQSFDVRGVNAKAVRASLVALKHVLEKRLPDNAREEPVALLNQATVLMEGTGPEQPESHVDLHSPLGALAIEYLQRALEGDIRDAIAVLTKAVADGVDPRVIIGEVLMAAQVEAGRLWHLNQLTVAEEHLITSTTQRAMSVVADHATPEVVPKERSVLAATIPEDHHDLGLRAIAHLLELDGWRVYFLGKDVPVDDLVSAASYFSVDLVMLAASMSIQLRNLREAVSALKQHGGVRAKVLVGGHAFLAAPEAWKTCGADGFAGSALEAVGAASKLVDMR